ncbi:MAG: type 1 glutamine amidotransferase [Chlamydiia bacterium]|nr:type 1 glutamine amidotransferase [Chlamydiia bacterium]
MKKVVALVHEIFEDLELMYPVIRMQEGGLEVVIAGEEKGKTYHGKHGYPCKSDVSFSDIEEDQFSAVLIPGGFAPDKLRRLPDVIHIVQEMDRAKKVIAFICHGGWVPISAKILKGKKVTGTTAIKDDLENAGAIWEDQELVIDGHLISSRTPADLPVFGKAIVEALS